LSSSSSSSSSSIMLPPSFGTTSQKQLRAPRDIGTVSARHAGEVPAEYRLPGPHTFVTLKFRYLPWCPKFSLAVKAKVVGWNITPGVRVCPLQVGGGWPALAAERGGSCGLHSEAELRARSLVGAPAPALPWSGPLPLDGAWAQADGKARLAGASGCVDGKLSPSLCSAHSFSVDAKPERAESKQRASKRSVTGNKLMAMLGHRGMSYRSSVVSSEEPTSGWMRKMLWRLRHYDGGAVNVVMAAVIFSSSINVGLEIECEMEGAERCTDITKILEHVFCVIFVLELAIRCLVEGPAACRTAWFQFDTVLISVSALSVWVLQPIVAANYDSNESAAWADAISQVTMLRTLRILRLLRVLRPLEQFHELWKLATGLLSSLRTVLAALTMILMTLYVFACFGMELVNYSASQGDDSAAVAVMQEHFSSVYVTMLTLIQFATGDGIADVYWPLVMKAWYLSFYFMAIWLIVTVVLMNLGPVAHRRDRGQRHRAGRPRSGAAPAHAPAQGAGVQALHKEHLRRAGLVQGWQPQRKRDQARDAGRPRGAAAREKRAVQEHAAGAQGRSGVGPVHGPVRVPRHGQIRHHRLAGVLRGGLLSGPAVHSH
ncbi:unnamed protein product, partial [Prorocentrum cordatum]